MTLVRRIAVLALVSLAGIALLAPVAARSALVTLQPVEERLLAVDAAPAPDAARGALTTREGTAGSASGPASGAERLVAAAPRSPGVAVMAPTLVTIATPPPSPAPSAPRPVTYSGTSVWDDLAQCESGGNWSINTGNGYYGGLQFSHSTWHAYGGGEFAEYPHEATREEQIVVAERLHAARGFQPWPACRVKLGLP